MWKRAAECELVVSNYDGRTAKKLPAHRQPLPEVGPIGERCISHDARLLVPISEAQVGEFALGEEKLERRGDGFIYYSEAIAPSRGSETRKLVTREAAKSSRL